MQNFKTACEVVPEICLTENCYVDIYIFINVRKNYQKKKKKKKKKKILAPHLLFSYTPALHDDTSVVSILFKSDKGCRSYSAKYIF